LGNDVSEQKYEMIDADGTRKMITEAERRSVLRD